VRSGWARRWLGNASALPESACHPGKSGENPWNAADPRQPHASAGEARTRGGGPPAQNHLLRHGAAMLRAPAAFRAWPMDAICFASVGLRKIVTALVHNQGLT